MQGGGGARGGALGHERRGNGKDQSEGRGGGWGGGRAGEHLALQERGGEARGGRGPQRLLEARLPGGGGTGGQEVYGGQWVPWGGGR